MRRSACGMKRRVLGLCAAAGGASSAARVPSIMPHRIANRIARILVTLPVISLSPSREREGTHAQHGEGEGVEADLKLLPTGSLPLTFPSLARWAPFSPARGEE